MVLRWGKAAVLMPDGDLAGETAYVLSAAERSSISLQIVLCLPDVLRQSRLAQTEAAIAAVQPETRKRTGFLIRNLDELGMIRELGLQEHFQGMLIADPFLYAYNSEALRFYLDLFPDLWFIGSDELTDREQQQTLQNSPLRQEQMIIKVYGHQPLMITDQCLSHNYTDCRQHLMSFTDSHKERFFAAGSCRQCYSTIYNGKCTWLLDKVNEAGYQGFQILMLDLTVEDALQVQGVLSFISQMTWQLHCHADAGATGQAAAPKSFTRAHHYKGVE